MACTACFYTPHTLTTETEPYVTPHSSYQHMVSRISSWTKPVLPANPLRTILEVRQRWEPPRIHAQGSGLLSQSKRVAAVPRLRVRPLQLGTTGQELRVLLAVGQPKSTHLRSRLFEGKRDAQPGDESSRLALGPGQLPQRCGLAQSHKLRHHG